MADYNQSKESTQLSNGSAPGEKHIMPELTRQATSITLSAEQFEKLYLTPLTSNRSGLSRKMGNPTPLALGSFALTTTPLSCCLMGWRGSGGSGIAFTGPMIFLGGSMLVISAILEFILGNTFPCAVFGTVGGFWLSFGATLIPSFNAAAPYSASTNNTMEGLSDPVFLSTYGMATFLFMAMDILVTIFTICATRTNAVFVTVFALLIPTFTFLSAAYWRLALGDELIGNRLIVGAGAVLFVVSLLGFYLFLAQLLESMAFPVQLPVGDLTPFWNRYKKRDPENQE